MEIRFYDQWDKRAGNDHKGKWGENTSTVMAIILSIACAFLFSYLIFAGGDGQASLESKETAPQEIAKPESLMYTVKRGDTLWGIAGRFYPEKPKELTVRLIMEKNGLEGTTIHAGQSILLP